MMRILPMIAATGVALALSAGVQATGWGPQATGEAYMSRVGAASAPTLASMPGRGAGNFDARHAGEAYAALGDDAEATGYSSPHPSRFAFANVFRGRTASGEAYMSRRPTRSTDVPPAAPRTL